MGEVKEFGKHIVADPRICHGQWTFRGTRIMVWIVLEQLAEEMPWDTIVKEWRGSVPREAIAEAVELAREVHRRDERRMAPYGPGTA
jgi:uncharacterized protein (DUF433 family)